MGIGNFPFPSFTLLLTLDRVVIPGPSYVIRLAPLEKDKHVDVDLIEEYPLANLEFENDSATDVAHGHCEAEEMTDDATSELTGASRRAEGEEVGVGVGVGMKFRFPFLKPRPSARFQLTNIFKRLSQSKLNGD